ncbi:hypothetical protein [Rubrivirga sp.]|uniref:hypothetical protein n=1 Tax=Rubrivirga sp. TaxID=1885344 RepID=UPI003B51E8BD
MFTYHTLARGGAALALLVSLAACDSGEPDDGAGEEELITQVSLTLTNTADASDAVTITGTASDGLVIDTFSPARVTLRPGATYDGSIELRDTINDEDITEEIEGEAEEHLFRYTFQPVSAGTVTTTDTESDYGSADANGGDFGVGLRFRASVAAGASGSGTLTAVLYHFDEGPKTSSTATSDEIDVDIAFPVSFGGASARR